MPTLDFPRALVSEQQSPRRPARVAGHETTNGVVQRCLCVGFQPSLEAVHHFCIGIITFGLQ
jgi:hypothetical protein